MIQRNSFRMGGLFAICFIFATASALHAQTSNPVLDGFVIDAISRQCIPYAHVALLSKTDTMFVKGTVSDSAGYFVLHPDSEGNYLLRVSILGYTERIHPVSFPALAPQLVELDRGSTLLSEVCIVDHHQLYESDGEKEIYNVSKDPTVAGSTLDNAIQNVPGIESDALGRITYRGVVAVDVWIDGHATHMEQESLTQYIKSLPAEKVDRIELITNPSARYQSGGPILNIVTNGKFVDRNYLSFGFGSDSRPALKPWASYVYSNEKIVSNLYAGLERRTSEIQYKGSETLMWNGDTSRQDSYTTQEEIRSNNPYIGFSLDYEIDSTRILSTWGNFYHGNEPTQSVSHHNRRESIFTPGDYTYSQLDSNDARYNTAEWGVSYERIFNEEGQELMAVFDANWTGVNYTGHIQRDYVNQPSLNFDRRLDHDRKEGIYFTEIMYNHPFETGTFVTLGVTSTISDNRRSYLDEYWLDASYQEDPLRSYNEHSQSVTTAAYTTVMQYLGRATLKVGLRAESRNIMLDYTGTASDYTYHTSYLIPSFHATYRTRSKHNFKFNFTRRCSPPKGSQITPFVKYDYDTYTVGNPHLNEAYTYNIEAGWNKYVERIGRLSATAYYRGISNEIVSTSGVAYDNLFGTVTHYSSYQNLGTSSALGVETTLLVQSNKRWKGQLYANLYQYRYEAMIDCAPISDEALCYNLRLHGSASLLEWCSLYINASYASRTISLQSVKAGSAGIDLGVLFSLCKKRLSAYASLEDVFNTSSVASSIFANNYLAYAYTKYPTQFLLVGITYRLGKMTLEQSAQLGDSFMKGGSN